MDRRQTSVRHRSGWSAKSLFRWKPGGELCYPKLLYALKRQKEPRHWTEFAAWMAQSWGPIENTWIVPLPGEHALGLARALQIFLSAPLGCFLSKIQAGPEQKERGKGARREVRLYAQVPKNCRLYTNVLLVDDVITTGATAQAAFEALGRPRNCQLWCLMDRLSCDASPALL
ncbi:MAG: ComF family protein [Bdellovibrionales bacterium]